MAVILAHAVHFGLVTLGLVGLGVLLLPQHRSRQRHRSQRAWQPPVTEQEHLDRVAELRRQIARGALTTTMTVPPRPQHHPRPAATATSRWLLLGMVSSLAAAIVHAEAFSHHANEGALVGAFFVLVTSAQVGWALAMRRAASGVVLRAGIAGNGLVLLVWALSRTTGLGPISPVEAPGALDLTAVVLELVVIATCLAGLRVGAGERRHSIDSHERRSS